MSVNGPSAPGGAGFARASQSYGVARTPAPPATATPKAAAAAAPPAGDALRRVLNDEERAYFEQIAQLGPLTYGPGRQRAAAPEAPRGLRLDVTG